MRHFLACVLCLSAVSPAEGETLTAVVLNHEGQPAAGAKVTAASFDSPPWRRQAVADEQGKVQIDLPGGAQYALAVRWQMQGLDTFKLQDAAGKEVSIKGQALPAQTIRLRPAGRLRGKVLRAEDGKPIAGAKLFMSTGEVPVSDENGSFEVIGLPMQDHSLIPVAPARVRQYVLFDTTLRPEAELELRLPRGAVIKGRVTDEQGAPIPGAYLSRASSGTILTLQGWNEACQADGTFVYGGLSDQRLFYNLEAEAPGFHSQLISAEVSAPGEVFERNVQLTREKPKPNAAKQDQPTAPAKTEDVAQLRRTVTGRVLDADGHPLDGASIRWGAEQWDPSVKRTKTDAKGSYKLENVATTQGAIMILADGYAPKFVTLREADEQFDEQLERGISVAGVVKSISGQPVAGVQVIPLTHCRDTGVINSIWLSERGGETNERGEFQLTALPENDLAFDFLKTGYSERRGVQLNPGEGNEVELQIGGGIRGRVVDSSGQPVRNFKIRVMIPRQYDPKEQVGGYYAGYDWYGISFTRDDGVFVLSDINANHWARFIVSAAGIGRAILDRVQSEPLDQLSPAEKLTIQLAPFNELKVKVIDAATQEPVSKALVSLLEDHHNLSYGFGWGHDDLWAERRRTDAQGMATFAEPSCEDGTLAVQAAGYARQRLACSDGEGTITVSLSPGAQLDGRVRMDGKPVADCYLRLTAKGDAPDRYSLSLNEQEGRFELKMLAEGTYELEIVDRNGRELDKRLVTLLAGQTHTENIEIAPPAKR